MYTPAMATAARTANPMRRQEANAASSAHPADHGATAKGVTSRKGKHDFAK
jgi:hypothetical protein